MYDGKKLLALIPARGGSKGIKNKNIIDLAGKPLIAYTIEAALRCAHIDQTVVTTDSEDIAVVARRYGASVPFLRPAEYARDTSKTIDAVLHAVDALKSNGHVFDVLILLQPTQPLRDSDDIERAIEVFFSNLQKSVVSISPVDDHPLLIRTIDTDGHLKTILPQNSTCRRQDMPPYYRVNGCIYINCISELSPQTSFNDNQYPYVMDKEHSVDIDDTVDLCIAEYYLRYRMETEK